MVDDVKADIMPRSRVPEFRIAKADDKFHARVRSVRFV